MTMSLFSSSETNKLLHYQEGNDTKKDPTSHHHIRRVVVMVVVMFVVMVVMFVMAVVMFVMMVVVFVVMVVVAVWRDGVWNEVKKSVAQQPAGCKTEQHLQQGTVLRGILKWDKKQDDKRGCTN